MRASSNVVQGTFSGASIARGTFSGATLEPGTFHYPQQDKGFTRAGPEQMHLIWPPAEPPIPPVPQKPADVPQK